MALSDRRGAVACATAPRRYDSGSGADSRHPRLHPQPQPRPPYFVDTMSGASSRTRSADSSSGCCWLSISADTRLR